MLKSIRYIDLMVMIVKQIHYYGKKNIVAEKVKLRREALGLSQEALAAKMQTMNVNIDQQMISKIEKNKRQVTDFEVACLCKCLGISANEILEDIVE